MNFLRRLFGPQPELRIIAVLLCVIAALLVLIWQEAKDINNYMPSPCGDGYNPCSVVIQS